MLCTEGSLVTLSMLQGDCPRLGTASWQLQAAVVKPLAQQVTHALNSENIVVCVVLLYYPLPFPCYPRRRCKDRPLGGEEGIRSYDSLTDAPTGGESGVHE